LIVSKNDINKDYFGALHLFTARGCSAATSLWVRCTPVLNGFLLQSSLTLVATKCPSGIKAAEQFNISDNKMSFGNKSCRAAKDL